MKLSREEWFGAVPSVAIGWWCLSNLSGGHFMGPGMISLVAAWSALELFNVAASFFDYWKLDGGYLGEQGFCLLKKTRIPLANVTLVRRFGLTSMNLVIEFTRRVPDAIPESIVMNPKDRNGFVAAIRQFAPQATFEV